MKSYLLERGPIMSAIIEQIKALPLMDNITNWICFALVAVILLCIATLMPKKNKKILTVESIVIAVAMTAVMVVARILAKMEQTPPTTLSSLFKGNVTTYVVYAVIAVVVWGIFFEKAPLTQALYGMCISVALPIGLFRLLLPTWTWSALDSRVQISSFAEVFSNELMLFKFLIYCALVFVPLWLIATGKYRLSLNTIWHLAYAVVGFGSVMQFLAQSGAIKIKYNGTLKQLLSIVTEDGLNKNSILELLSLLGVGALLIVLISAVAAIIRKKTTGEKVINSETSFAMMTRLAGRILAIVVSGLLIVFLPTMLGATNMETLVGMPLALVFLTPFAAILVITTVAEFIAEHNEIKVAKAAYEAEE